MDKKETVPEMLARLLAINDQKSRIEYNKIILEVRQILKEEYEKELIISEQKEEYEKCIIIQQKLLKLKQWKKIWKIKN